MAEKFTTPEKETFWMAKGTLVQFMLFKVPIIHETTSKTDDNKHNKLFINFGKTKRDL